MRAFLFLFAVLSISACQLIDGPSMMPTGYKYQTQTYKSQPGHDPHHCVHDEHHAHHDTCGCDEECGCSHGCECSGQSACGCDGHDTHDGEKICVVNEDKQPMCSSCNKGHSEPQPPKRFYNE